MRTRIAAFHVVPTSHKTIRITLRVSGHTVTTEHMPHVISLLEKELPSILRSTCFNEANLPFFKEVLATELGHLFEHMLLEYLCLEKLRVGYKEALFNGITSWDWNTDPYGTFHIEVDVRKKDTIFLGQALQKTLTLFEKILQYPQPPLGIPSHYATSAALFH